MSIQKQREQSITASGPPTSTSKTVTKFGWIEGVLIRCMASIFGLSLIFFFVKKFFQRCDALSTFKLGCWTSWDL